MTETIAPSPQELEESRKAGEIYQQMQSKLPLLGQNEKIGKEYLDKIAQRMRRFKPKILLNPHPDGYIFYAPEESEVNDFIVFISNEKGLFIRLELGEESKDPPTEIEFKYYRSRNKTELCIGQADTRTRKFKEVVVSKKKVAKYYADHKPAGTIPVEEVSKTFVIPD